MLSDFRPCATSSLPLLRLQAAAAQADVAAVYSPTSSSSAPLAFAQAPNGTADPSAAASSAAVAPAAHSAADAPAAAASSAGAAPAAAAASQAQRTAVAGLAEAVTSAGMSLAAALMQKQHRGKPPGIAELAVEILEVLCSMHWVTRYLPLWGRRERGADLCWERVERRRGGAKRRPGRQVGMALPGRQAATALTQLGQPRGDAQLIPKSTNTALTPNQRSSSCSVCPVLIKHSLPVAGSAAWRRGRNRLGVAAEQPADSEGAAARAARDAAGASAFMCICSSVHKWRHAL